MVEQVFKAIFFKKMYLFIVYTVFSLHACMPAGQKSSLGLITDGWKPPCGCWELDSGPLKE